MKKTKRKWTDSELELLKELYEDYTIKIPDIALVLGRSKNSIMAKAQMLGIKKKTTQQVEVQEGYKICSKCFKIKKLEEFYNNKSKSYGVESYCKTCSLEIRNKVLIRKAVQKVLKVEKEKQKFIEENKDSTFKCSYCKGYHKIEEFSIINSNGKFKRNVYCKKCSREITKKSQYNRYSKLGHR